MRLLLSVGPLFTSDGHFGSYLECYFIAGRAHLPLATINEACDAVLLSNCNCVLRGQREPKDATGFHPDHLMVAEEGQGGQLLYRAKPQLHLVAHNCAVLCGRHHRADNA